MKIHAASRGFTLVELLTVIAIIALLAAILFPVFSRVRARGYQTTCLSNLSQLGKAFAMYMQDSGGFIPTWCIDNTNDNQVNTNRPTGPGGPHDISHPVWLTWDVTLMPYMRNRELLACRGNPIPPPPEGTIEDPTKWAGIPHRAYAIAHYTQKRIDGGIGTEWVHVRGAYQDEIPAPSRTVLLFEKGRWRSGAWADALGQNVFESHHHKTSEDYPDDADWLEDMFHFEGKNFLYLDGHAKFSVAGQYPFNHTSTRPGSWTGTVWVAGRQADGGDWPDRE